MTREEAIMVLEMVDAYGLADEAKKMAISALSAEPKVAYACDGRRCGADCSDCGRTTDIEHAKNFTKVCDSYFEKLQTEPSDLISKAGAIAALEKLYQYEELEIQNAKDMPYKYTDTFVESTEWKKAGIAHAIRELYDVPSIPSAARPTKPILVKTNMILNNEDFERLRLQLIAQNKDIVLLPAGVKECDRPTIVRCKDCEHRHWDKTSEFWTCYHTMDLAIDDNDFCSLAKMKGGAE